MRHYTKALLRWLFCGLVCWSGQGLLHGSTILNTDTNGVWLKSLVNDGDGWAYVLPGQVLNVPAVRVGADVEPFEFSAERPDAIGRTVYDVVGNPQQGNREMIITVFRDGTNGLPVYSVYLLPDRMAEAKGVFANGLYAGFALCALFAGWWAVKGMWKSFQGGDTISD